jgi:hypothetical protein
MAIEKTFRALQVELGKLREALEALGTTIDEDRPAPNAVAVTARLGDSVLAIRGAIEEARAAAAQAVQSATHPMDTERARRALAGCQEQFHRFVSQFVSDLMSYENLEDLMSVARERGRHWERWVSVVRQGLDQCRVLADQVRDALFLCWQELAEKLGTASVSVQNTTIGQQITLPENEFNESERGEFARHEIP